MLRLAPLLCVVLLQLGVNPSESWVALRPAGLESRRASPVVLHGKVGPRWRRQQQRQQRGGDPPPPAAAAASASKQPFLSTRDAL